MRIGIIGLGMLGNAIAIHLLNSGFKITVYNRTNEKTNQTQKMGATVATSPKELAKNSDLVIIML